MGIESPGMHYEHFHKNPHPERPEVTEMKKVFAAKKFEFTEIAKRYMGLDNEQLQKIINDCGESINEYDALILRLDNSNEYNDDEKEAHKYQVGRTLYYLRHRKETAELILESRSKI